MDYGALHWRAVSVEELREFMRELVMETSLRHAAKLISRGHEMVRKFIDGTIQTPQERTRRAMAELYLARRRLASRVQASPATPSAGQLAILLPKGVDAAKQEIHKVFALLEGTGKAPPTAALLEQWLVRRVEEEYATEVRYAPRRAAPDGGKKGRGKGG